MENASKAILIAGAILVTLVVITIVIIYFQAGANTTSEIATNTIENQIQSHNAQFNIFEGTGRKKGDIDRLNSAIDKNNSRSDKVCHVYISLPDELTNIDASGKIRYYTVNVLYNGNGAIYKVEVD